MRRTTWRKPGSREPTSPPGGLKSLSPTPRSEITSPGAKSAGSSWMREPLRRRTLHEITRLFTHTTRGTAKRGTIRGCPSPDLKPLEWVRRMARLYCRRSDKQRLWQETSLHLLLLLLLLLLGPGEVLGKFCLLAGKVLTVKLVLLVCLDLLWYQLLLLLVCNGWLVVVVVLDLSLLGPLGSLGSPLHRICRYTDNTPLNT